MIKEAYVSFETAKLLKEKGFDWHTQYVYTLDGTGSIPPKIGNWRAKSNIQKPTLQMAMRWLREMHKLYVDILYSEYLYSSEPFYWSIELLNEKPIVKRIIKFSTSLSPEEYTYRTYEEAVDAAIQYSLKNLI